MKLLSVVIALMIILSTPILYENVHAQNNNQSITENLSFYLKNDTYSHIINNLTTTYTFNTTMGSRGSVDSAKHYIIEDWYLSPVLADNFNIFNATFWIFIRFNGTDNNPNLYVNISERSPGGQESTIASGSSHPVLATSVESYSVFLPIGNFTIPAGYSIHVHFQLSGGTSTIYWVYYGNSTYASGISFNTATHLKIESVATLNYNYTPTIGFNPQWKNKTMYIETKISDPLGGYDIRNVSCFFDNKSYPMKKIDGTPDSFYSIYEFSTNFSTINQGNHTLIVYALDNNGYYYYLNYFKYYYYLKSYETYFWIGLPLAIHVSLLSSSGIPLSNARVEFHSNGAIYENITNNAGIANIYMFSGTYYILIYWNKTYLSKSMEIFENISSQPVNNNVVSVNKSVSLTIYADVGTPVIRILDSKNMPVYNALLYITFPNGERLIFNTNKTGYVDLGTNPGGIYIVDVYYKNVLVGNGTLDFIFNRTSITEILNLNVNIYHVFFQVIDSHGNGIFDAKLYMLSNYGVETFNSTDYYGFTTVSVPSGIYSITVTWLGVSVYSSNIDIKNNSFITLNANIFYLNLSFVDGENKTLTSAYFSINGNGITMLNQEISNITTVKLPIGIYNITTFWYGKEVNSTTINLTRNVNIKINASVYYLTVNVYDSNKNPLNGTEIFIEQDGNVLAYSSQPVSVFRMAKGNYTILVKFNTEYYLTPVSLSNEKNISLNSNQNYSFVMSYPPSIFETYLLYIILTFAVLIVAFSLAVRHRKK